METYELGPYREAELEDGQPIATNGYVGNFLPETGVEVDADQNAYQRMQQLDSYREGPYFTDIDIIEDNTLYLITTHPALNTQLVTRTGDQWPLRHTRATPVKGLEHTYVLDLPDESDDEQMALTFEPETGRHAGETGKKLEPVPDAGNVFVKTVKQFRANKAVLVAFDEDEFVYEETSDRFDKLKHLDGPLFQGVIEDRESFVSAYGEPRFRSIERTAENEYRVTR